MPNPELVRKALKAKRTSTPRNEGAIDRVIAHQVAASLRMEGVQATAVEVLRAAGRPVLAEALHGASILAVK
jgi:hypothetical protein